MRLRKLAVFEFLRDQRDMLDLTKRVATCRTSGHQTPETLLWEEVLVRVCPRCGKETFDS